MLQFEWIATNNDGSPYDAVDGLNDLPNDERLMITLARYSFNRDGVMTDKQIADVTEDELDIKSEGTEPSESLSLSRKTATAV